MVTILKTHGNRKKETRARRRRRQPPHAAIVSRVTAVQR